MKTANFKLVTAFVLFFCLGPFWGVQAQNKYTIVRTIEVYSGLIDSKIVTVYEDGRIEEAELEKFRSKAFTDNSKKILDVINSLATKGYTLISSSTGNGDAVVITTFMFSKN